MQLEYLKKFSSVLREGLMRGKGGTGKNSNKEVGRTVKMPNRIFGRYQEVRKIHTERQREIKKVGDTPGKRIRANFPGKASYRISQDRNLTEL